MARHGLRVWIRRWAALAFLLPVSVLLLWPIFWAPLDNRSYDYFHAQRSVAPWTEVAVVGIDRATREELFTRPVFPLSRHVQEHARLTRHLVRAGARAIVFDLQLGSDAFASSPDSLAEAFRSSGRVVLVMSLRERRQVAKGGGARHLLTGELPDPSLVEASEGAFVADVRRDADEVVRRFLPDPEIARLGLETLPEHLAGFKARRPVPIEFPSLSRPVPTVSYKDAVSGAEAVHALLHGRIVFIGLTEDSSTDYVAVPRLQDLGGGIQAFGLPGVVVLAAITETLLRGAPIRDAGTPAALAWVTFWCLAAVTILPGRRPVLSALVLGGVILVAIVATGVLHIAASLVFPAGLLFGSLFVCGVYTMVASYIETTKELHAEEVENRRIHQEMEAARRTQERFLPKEIPSVEGFDIWGTNISSATVSGDYFDVLDLGPARPLLLAIADVAGKGLPASLLMSSVQAGLHSHTFLVGFDLRVAAENLNRLVYQNTDAKTFVTLFLGELDKRTGRLRYVRAGHDYPLWISQGGAVRSLEDGGTFLGFLPEVLYEVGEIVLGSNDLLCLYTDGITEAKDCAGVEYGVERLCRILAAHGEESARGIGEGVLRDVEAFTGHTDQGDDVTLVIVKVGELAGS